MTKIPATAESTAVTDAAARLRRAAESGIPVAPVRDLIGRDDVDAAYAVQRLNVEARLAAGATIVGHKIGLTSPVVQQQIGVDQPDIGVLLDDMAFTDGDSVPFAAASSWTSRNPILGARSPARSRPRRA